MAARRGYEIFKNKMAALIHQGLDHEARIHGSVRPPTFIVFTDKAGDMHFSAERFLINRLREKFGFEGTPIVLKTKRR